MRMTPTTTGLAVVIVAGALIATAGDARAQRHLCPQADPDTIDVDGMLDDWRGVAPVRAGGPDLDASFDLRCQYDGQRLQVVVDVRDDLLVRNGAARGRLQAGEDRLELQLSAGGAPLTLILYPGHMKHPPRRLVAGAAAPRWLLAEDTQQKRGWSAELDVPLARIAGWSPSTPSLTARVLYHDSDRFAAGAAESTVELAAELDLGEKKDLLQAFLQATRLKKKDLSIDAQVDVDRTRVGRERVVAGGAYVGVIADQFAYVQLPVKSGADVARIELADLRGDGSRVILAQVRQSGGGGMRTLLVGYTARGGRIEPLFSVEVGKELGGRVLTSRWRVTPAAAGRKRPELIVEASPAVGWDEDSYAESPAPDADPIHLPWDDDRWGGAYWLSGDRIESRVLSGKRPR
jgi:hypothetical protein